MADPNVIDGLTSVRAVRRAGHNTKGPRFRSSPSKLPKAKIKDNGYDKKKKPVARISKTAVPVKYEIQCYECSYTFILHGKITNTICPKCHKSLESSDLVVDKEWSGSLKTIGTIKLNAEGKLKDSDITARNMILAGDASGGYLRIYQRLELCPGARFDLGKIDVKDLLIRPGGKFIITRKLKCRNLEVKGNIKVKVIAKGVITVRAGGFLRGEVQAGHLIVEDGGGLKAKMFIK